MRIIILVLPIAILACASNPHKAVELDTKVAYEAQVTSSAVIGVKNGDMIYQKKALMSEELRNLQITVYELEAKLYGGPRYYDNNGLIGALKICRAKLSLPENGGDGKLAWTEKRDYVVPEDEFTAIGMNEKKDLIGVQEEFLKDRLQRFLQYKQILQGRAEDLQSKIDVCSAELSAKTTSSVATNKYGQNTRKGSL